MHNPPRQSGVREGIGAWLIAFKASWQRIVRVDRASITAFQAIRSALGVALPLAVGIATGFVLTGVAIASGALLVGAVGLKDPARARVRAMLLISFFITLSALIGGLIGSHGWLPVLLVGIWGTAAGLFASNGQVAQVVGVQSCATLIVYAHLKLDPAHALLTAGLVGCGALLQTLLALLPSPWITTVPERTALSTIYQKLADYTSYTNDKQDTLVLSDALLSGRTTLLHSNLSSPRGRLFARLLEDAEHVRLTLTILLNERQHLREREGSANEESINMALDQLLQAARGALTEIVSALSHGEKAQGRSSEERKAALMALRTVHDQEMKQRIFPSCAALLSELRIARELASSWQSVRQFWPAHLRRLSYARPPRLHLEHTWSNIRANLTLRSSAFRHALRLGLTLALGTTLSQFFTLPAQRGYWIPMTAALVLRSDFITTYTRGLARMLGTLLGAVLTTLLLVFLPTSDLLSAVLIALTAYLMFATILANYTIFSVATTVATVLLLSFTSAPTLETAVGRAIDTAIGGVLALLVYALWPTWEQTQVPENVALRLETLGTFLNSVLDAYAWPGTTYLSVFEKHHMQSRLARTNALGSVQRSLQEPKTHRVDADLAEGVLGAADNIARSTLTLEAYLLDHPQHDTLPEMGAFGAAVEEALTQLATAIRAGQPLATPLDLHPALQKLHRAYMPHRRGHADEQWRFVGREVRQIAKHMHALARLLMTDTLATRRHPTHG